jgi:hypothetical protein
LPDPTAPGPTTPSPQRSSRNVDLGRRILIDFQSWTQQYNEPDIPLRTVGAQVFTDYSLNDVFQDGFLAQTLRQINSLILGALWHLEFPVSRLTWLGVTAQKSSQRTRHPCAPAFLMRRNT